MTSLYIIAAIALCLAAYLAHRNHRLTDEANRLAEQLDRWTTTGMHYWRSYPRFEWPAAYPGHQQDVTDRNIAMTQFDYEGYDPDSPTANLRAIWLADCNREEQSDWHGYCVGCGTEDTGRFAGVPADSSVCIDCGHWIVQKPEDPGPHYLDHGRNPHLAYIAIPRFDGHDGIMAPRLEYVTIEQARKLYQEECDEYAKGEDGCFDRTYDVHVAYIPPLHGPWPAIWAEWSSKDFAPAGVADDDDIPF